MSGELKKDVTLMSNRERLLNFVNKETLKEILEAFTTTTGLMANIVDTEGRSIFSRKELHKNSEFCRTIYSFENGLKRCQGAYKRAGKQAAMFNAPYIFRCPAGLIEWAAPIIIEGDHLGTIICGQVLLWEPEEFFWIELREMNKSLTSDFKAIFSAVEQLPIVSGQKVQAASYLLYVVANYIMKAGWENYKKAKEYDRQLEILFEEIETRKQSENEVSAKPFIHAINMETELVELLRTENIDEARVCYQNILTNNMIENQNNLQVARIRLVELAVLISRVFIRAGMDIDIAYRLNNRIIEGFYHAESMEKLHVYAAGILNDYFEAAGSHEKSKQNTKIETMEVYIEQNYARDISLEDIAGSAFISVSYASRIFKKSKNISIMDYVTNVRITKAKKLLVNPNYPIIEVAKSVGYDDASYFTKVFTKTEDMTPSEYRKILR